MKALRAVNHAHMIDNHNGTVSCSHCHTWFYKDDRQYYMRYCPYCNVKMVESEGKEKATAYSGTLYR